MCRPSILTSVTAVFGFGSSCSEVSGTNCQRVRIPVGRGSCDVAPDSWTSPEHRAVESRSAQSCTSAGCNNQLGPEFSWLLHCKKCFRAGNCRKIIAGPKIRDLKTPFLGLPVALFLCAGNGEKSEALCVIPKRSLYATRFDLHFPNGLMSLPSEEALCRLPNPSVKLVKSTLCVGGRAGLLDWLICNLLHFRKEGDQSSKGPGGALDHDFPSFLVDFTLEFNGTSSG